MKQVRSVAVSFDYMLRDIKKIILLTLTHPVKLTFPAEGINQRARRKPTTFGRVLTNLFPRVIIFKSVLTSVVRNHFIGSND